MTVVQALDAPLTPQSVFVCPTCQTSLAWSPSEARCTSCALAVPVVDGLARFVYDYKHENFALQWNRFADVQLDSRNALTLSRDRLLGQSHLRPEDFAGRLVLEVGCGAGRFTEILLSFGAKVVATDYSGAVDACSRSHCGWCDAGALVTAQADVFCLPVRPEFDIVLGYGMLQHTGNPEKALQCLWSRVKPGGLLLVDRYAISLRHAKPFKYALRPLTRRLPVPTLLRAVEGFCGWAIPVERQILRRLQGGGPVRKALRRILNRLPNSVYPLYFELEGRVDRDFALRWCVLETFDQYGSRYDWPCTGLQWRRELERLEGRQLEWIGTSGQGHVATVRKISA